MLKVRKVSPNQPDQTVKYFRLAPKRLNIVAHVHEVVILFLGQKKKGKQ